MLSPFSRVVALSRRHRSTLALVASLALLTPWVSAGASPSAAPVSTTAPTAAPLLFVQNAGQWASAARFQAQTSAGTLWLAGDGSLWLTVLSPESKVPSLKSHPTPADRRAPLGAQRLGTRDSEPETGVNLRLAFVGANPHPTLVPFARQSAHVSYFIGHDAASWHPDVPVWAGVRLVGIYPGIDLTLDGTSGTFQPQLVIESGRSLPQDANLAAVRLRVEGAQSVRVSGGALVAQTAVGVVTLPLFAVRGGRVTAQAQVEGDEVVAPFGMGGVTTDAAGKKGLVYSPYLGGSGLNGDIGHDIVVDGVGDAYVTGGTASSDFPVTKGAFQTMCKTTDGCYNAFVTKLNGTGTGLVYSTYLGGSGADLGNRGDYGYGIAVDGHGDAYVIGTTTSNDFPVTKGAFQITLKSGNGNVFVTQLNGTGTGLVYSTYLGGSGSFGDEGSRIKVDGHGDAYVIGTTTSSDFPVTTGTFQTTLKGSYNAFVTKLNVAGTGLVYSTYLGGNVQDIGAGIAVDGQGNTYITGATQSKNFPVTTGAFQTTNKCAIPSCLNAFVTKLNGTGTGLIYSTYLGGSGGNIGYGDPGNDIVVDGQGNAYVTGGTTSTNFPVTKGAFQTRLKSKYGNAFVTKLNATGTGLVYSTYLGGTSDNGDEGFGIAVDGQGTADVTGNTSSPDFSVTKGAFQTHNKCHGTGCYTAFVTKLNGTGTRLIYSTYLGGSSGDDGFAIAVDGRGAAYLAGITTSTDFPTTTGAFQTTLKGFENAFVTKLPL